MRPIRRAVSLAATVALVGVGAVATATSASAADTPQTVFEFEATGQVVYLYLGGGDGTTYIDWNNNGVKDTSDPTVGTGNATGSGVQYFGVPTTGTVTVRGKFTNIGSASQTASQMKYLKAVTRWDASAGTTDLSYAFNQASNLVSVATPPPGITEIHHAFSGASSFNQDIGDWDVSKVTNMFEVFSHATAFNGDIGNWNTSSVTSMSSMFWDAPSFNQDISKWDTSNVTRIQYMFLNATSFNQDIGKWDVSNVTNMTQTLFGAEAFNQDLSCWNVAKVTVNYLFNDGANAAWVGNPAFQPQWGTEGCVAPSPVYDFTAVIDNIDHETQTATITGTGTPGNTVTITGGSTPVTANIDTDGTWTATITGLEVGETTLVATQLDTQGQPTGDPIELVVILEAVPVIDPAIGGLALVTLIGAAGVTHISRRRKVTA